MMKWGYGSSKQFIGGNPLREGYSASKESKKEVLAVDLSTCNEYKNGLNVVKKSICPTLFIFGELRQNDSIRKRKKIR